MLIFDIVMSAATHGLFLELSLPVKYCNSPPSSVWLRTTVVACMQGKDIICIVGDLHLREEHPGFNFPI